MSRSYWSIYVRESGSLYNADGSIPRPNADLALEKTSTATKVILSDGTVAFVSPSNHSNKNVMTFSWVKMVDSDGLKTKIDGYIDANDIVKIVTHVGGREFIGKFINCKAVWLVGQVDESGNDVYSIEASFEFTA